jgi:hypothetical protein
LAAMSWGVFNVAAFGSGGAPLIICAAEGGYSEPRRAVSQSYPRGGNR